MRSRQLFLVSTILLLATSCGHRRCCDDIVVCETYVHPYGLEMSGGEWCRQGSSGDVIATRIDGVTIKKSYQKGELDGEVTYSFPFRDKVEKTEIYGHGQLVQESRCYPSGVTRETIEYVSPNERLIKTNYDQGTRQTEEHYLGDKLQKGTYYNLKEVVESSVAEYSGKTTRRDTYGQLLSVDTVEDGHVVLSTTYHPNGMPEAITPYRNGVVEGSRKTFLPGGEPYTIEEWQGGQRNGNTIVYQHGEKIAEVPYVKGGKGGVERHFRNEEEVVEEICWFNDLQHGPRIRYVDGQAYTDWYYNGAPVTKAVYDKRTALLQQP